MGGLLLFLLGPGRISLDHALNHREGLLDRDVIAR